MKTRFHPTRSTVVATLSLLAGFAGSAFADLLVHEPFEYERRQGYVNADIRGEGIVGLNGGTGFSGAWFMVPADNAINDLNAGIPEGPGDFGTGETYGVGLGSRTAPLSYVDAQGNRLVTSGNQVRMAFGNRSWNRRPLSAPLGGPGSTVWLSFLAQSHNITTDASRYGFVELSQNGTQRLWVGKVTPIRSGHWGINLPDNKVGPVSGDFGGPAMMNEQSMILVKLEYAEAAWDPMRIKVWVNPPDLTSESALPAPAFNNVHDYVQFNQLGLAGRYSTDMDEIRIGTTFDSVTPSEFVPPVVELPSLAIARDGGNVVISWPASAVGFSLYSSEDLLSWTPVSQAPVVQGDFNTVEVTTEASRLFFRLRQWTP
jgi:hypothetical protein